MSTHLWEYVLHGDWMLLSGITPSSVINAHLLSLSAQAWEVQIALFAQQRQCNS